jgi:hypothetical protein
VRSITTIAAQTHCVRLFGADNRRFRPNSTCAGPGSNPTWGFVRKRVRVPYALGKGDQNANDRARRRRCDSRRRGVRVGRISSCRAPCGPAGEQYLHQLPNHGDSRPHGADDQLGRVPFASAGGGSPLLRRVRKNAQVEAPGRLDWPRRSTRRMEFDKRFLTDSAAIVCSERVPPRRGGRKRNLAADQLLPLITGRPAARHSGNPSSSRRTLKPRARSAATAS